MYIANFYIGREYTPGEVLPETVPQEVIDRLLKAGAIRKVAPAPDAAAGPEEDEGTEQKTEVAEIKKGKDRGTEKETGADEIDEDLEPEEIDVMAGIVAEPKAASKSKGRTGGRKSK